MVTKSATTLKERREIYFILYIPRWFGDGSSENTLYNRKLFMYFE